MNSDKLATSIFLILHDPFTGKPSLGAGALKCGVTGAELAELITDRRLGMENDRIVLADAEPQGADEIATFVLQTIRSQTEAHTVPSWVAALADPLFDLVATRLVDEGVVHRAGRGLLGRGPERFPSVDLLRAAGPRVRLEHMLREPDELDPAGSVCAAVLGALGADRVLDVDGDRAAVRRAIAAVTDSLPVDLRSLLTGLEVAHASGALPPSLRLRVSDS